MAYYNKRCTDRYCRATNIGRDDKVCPFCGEALHVYGKKILENDPKKTGTGTSLLARANLVEGR
jgi:hypothetical protein